jgi:putative transposase
VGGSAHRAEARLKNGDTAMEQKTTSHVSSSSQLWERLEALVREPVRRRIQALLEAEMTTLWGRPPSARRAAADAPKGVRHGDGKPRRLPLSIGPMTVRRLRVRGRSDRFVRRVLPLVQRRTRQVGEVWPQLSWHGLARGDGALARRKAHWQLAYEAWKQGRLEDGAVVYVWADGLSVKVRGSRTARPSCWC